MRYTMLYLKTKNVNLIKDMGMIPYKLYKKFGFDSHVATYDYGNFTYINKEVAGLKLDYVKKITGNFSIDGMLYLFKNSRKIDILHIFHVTISSVIYANIYKLLNPRGKIYLKLDCSYKLPEKINSISNIKKNFMLNFLNKIDLISVEEERLYEELKVLFKKNGDKLMVLPNGVDYDFLNDNDIYYDYKKKGNIILNVARVGTEEKNTELLLEGFSKISEHKLKDWKLVIAGPIEREFNSYIQEYFNKYPNLKDKVIFKGDITDRKEIFKLYEKAKIFCLTSKFESFGIAFIEAASLGDIIVSTDVGIASEIVQEKNGAIIKNHEPEELSRALEKIIDNENLEEICTNTARVCREKFDWNVLINKLHNKLINLV